MDNIEESSSKDSHEPPRKKAKYIAEKDPSKRDLANLPHDVLLRIFKHLDLRSINNCAMLCSTLNSIAKDSSLYRDISLKYNMTNYFLESLVSKISRPRTLFVEYKFHDPQAEEEDYTDFNKYVALLLRKSGEHLSNLKIDSCRSDEVLLCVSECINLTRLELYRCKSTFQTLPQLCTLKKLKFISSHFPPKTVSEIVKNNPQLKQVTLSDNVNVNGNEICEIMSNENLTMRELHLSERKKLKAKSLRTLGRLKDLKVLEVISGFECDPEDSLEQIAAGCEKLERLAIYGWKELNDENFAPALQMFTQLKELDLRGTNITIKTCREAVLTLPKLKTLDVFKSRRIKKKQLVQLQKDFQEVYIAVD